MAAIEALPLPSNPSPGLQFQGEAFCITCALQLEMQPNEAKIVQIKQMSGEGGNKQKSGSMCVKWVFLLIW